MNRLGDRLGVTMTVSPLRHKILRLMRDYPAPQATTMEDWLVDLANHRGVRVVFRAGGPVADATEMPTPDLLSDEEWVTALCQPQSQDRPQILRLAAQRISRPGLDLARLLRLARMERTQPVLAELARQALRVDPGHPAWQQIHQALDKQPALRSPLIHWTRLGEPIMMPGRPNAAGWRLVS